MVNNSEPVLSRIYKNEVRTILFNYLKSLKIEEKLGTQTLFERKLTFQKVTGYMAYLKSVDEKAARIYSKGDVRTRISCRASTVPRLMQQSDTGQVEPLPDA